MITREIKKLHLVLLAAIVAELIALAFAYPLIEVYTFNLGVSSHNIIQLVLR
jgi:hypothetical protein